MSGHRATSGCGCERADRARVRHCTACWPPVLTAAQAASFLHLASAREVLKLARRGELPSLKLGKRRLFLRDELIEALKKRQTPAVPGPETVK